jgi:nitrite reductase/ring-hydroxylating ferredoxin subunit
MSKEDDGFQKVANMQALKEGGGLLGIEANGNKIVLAMVEGQVYAIDSVCSHRGGPLDEGSLNGHDLKCPWHYAVFDVRDGKVSDRTVWATNQRSYPVKVDEHTGNILVNIRAGTISKGGKSAANV